MCLDGDRRCALPFLDSVAPLVSSTAPAVLNADLDVNGLSKTQEMLDAIRTGTISYDFEDYKSLLNLMCGIDQSAKDDASANNDPGSAVPLSGGGGDRSRRMYNEYLIDLFALDVEG
jgi:hypothetical protein